MFNSNSQTKNNNRITIKNEKNKKFNMRINLRKISEKKMNLKKDFTHKKRNGLIKNEIDFFYEKKIQKRILKFFYLMKIKFLKIIILLKKILNFIKIKL